MNKKYIPLVLSVVVIGFGGCAVATMPTSAEQGAAFRNRVEGTVPSVPVCPSYGSATVTSDSNSPGYAVRLSYSGISDTGDYVQKGNGVVSGHYGMVGFLDDRIVFQHSAVPSPVFFSSITKADVHYARDGGPYLWLLLNDGREFSIRCDFESNSRGIYSKQESREQAAREALAFVQGKIGR